MKPKVVYLVLCILGTLLPYSLSSESETTVASRCGTLTVGVSLALPLFLYLRERRLEVSA